MSKIPTSRTRLSFPIARFAAALGIAAALLNPNASAQGLTTGAVYTQTNADGPNEIAIYDRAADGVITFNKFVATGGDGTGGGLGNQGAVILTDDERFLLAVNAGSDEISVFRILEETLELLAVESSRGVRPVSIAQRGNLVYVVNAGNDRIAGFEMDDDGDLTHINGSKRKLSGSETAPAQISFSPDGEYLYVTEKATQTVSRFRVRNNGRANKGVAIASNGQTPFGFAFGLRDQLFVSEAAAGADGLGTVTSLRVKDKGVLAPITLSAATTQTATCWVAATPDGRVIYASNTGSDSVSSFRVGFEGQIILDNPQAATTGARPLDVAITRDGNFFYVLNAGAGGIGDYRIDPDASLASLPGSNAGLPDSASGLAAR